MKKGTGELTPIEGQGAKKESHITISLLSSPEFDADLSDSSVLIAHASMTEQEIDELIKKRESAKKKLDRIDSWKKERIEKIEKFTDPLDVIAPADYDMLLKAGLLTTEDAKKLEALDAQIQKAKSIQHPSQDIKNAIEKHTTQQGEVHKEIREVMHQRQRQFRERIETLKNKLAKIYIERAGKLTALLADIESQPRVMDRLKKIEEEQTEKKEREEREIQTKILNECTRMAQSMRDRHEHAFKRIAEALDDPNIKERILSALEQSQKSTTFKQSEDYFRKIGDQLIRSILTEEGDKQIKSLKETTPRIMPGGIDYSEAKRNLENAANLTALTELAEKGSVQAKKLLEQRELVLKESGALDKILEQKNMRGENIFLATFQRRRENDKNDMTKKLQEAREEQEKTDRLAKKEQEKQKHEMKEIVARGGFYVDVPQSVFIGGEWRLTGEKRQGVVRMEEVISKKGNKIWKITEVAGAAKDANLLGKVSSLNMNGFPQWLKDAAKK
ncbi:hypothetical protein HYW94_03145 [Candidatus Uhrbacteria bacterium]|nr:hypothetical protein [Candidatus Uhrbacteria bacterium]